MTNKDIIRIQLLARGKARKETGQYLIEGKRLVQSAIEMRADLETVFNTEPFQKDNPGFMESIQNTGISCEQIQSKIMEKLSFTKTPSGIAAVCSLPKKDDPNLSQNQWLYLDQISDPGNLGTLFRSAAWFNFSNVALSPDCVDPFNPKAVRAGMGAHFGLSIHTNIDLNLFAESHTLIGADHRGDSLGNIENSEKFMLVLGSEAHGLSESILEKLDFTVAIEKRGFGESLNVGVAGAILMYELSKNI
ncbi:MAG: RNA methyltransferase [Candidatus Marinimicrobia bacterium]|nr:RNA methyltransferase [Candidatus Neomarinimicrobiota bacterium]